MTTSSSSADGDRRGDELGEPAARVLRSQRRRSRPAQIEPTRARRRREALTAWGYLSPAALLLALVFLFPMVMAVVLSFSSYDVVKRTIRLVRLDNYMDLLQNPVFLSSVLTTVKWTVAVVFLSYGLALAIAGLVNGAVHGARLYRVLFGLPWAVPPVFAALIWAALWDPNGGGVNGILKSAGIGDGHYNWLGSTDLALPSLVIVGVWRFAPFMVLSILAGMQSVDPQLYEAAALDGAGGWRRFWSVTFPLIRPVSVVVLTLTTIWAARHFDMIWTLTHGGPANATHVISVYSYEETVLNANVGNGSTAAVILSVLLLALALTMSKRLTEGAK